MTIEHLLAIFMKFYALPARRGGTAKAGTAKS